MKSIVYIILGIIIGYFVGAILTVAGYWKMHQKNVFSFNTKEFYEWMGWEFPDE
jgi:hypothetical protein